LISDVVDLQAARAEAKGLYLRIGIVDDCPEIVQTDPVRLRQIMLNLVGNAVKFTEQGVIEVLAETREISSDDPAVQKSELRLSVVDSGIGMTDDQLSRVFTAFSQADGSTSRQFGGTGLGLAISRRLVELLGGEIHVDSEYGMGSTFTVIIPITATSCKLPIRSLPPSATHVTVSPKLAPPTKLTPSTPSAAKKLSDAMILLVEDGIDNQRLISHVLKHAGAQVDVAANGQIALDLIHQGKKTYDVVLMDMQMPVLDGYHATRQLRQEGYDMPIVALTAHAMADDQARCLEAGCDDYLTKPINRVAIVDVLGKQLARRCSEVG
jgi:CheY-like chemotaxis protein